MKSFWNSLPVWAKTFAVAGLLVGILFALTEPVLVSVLINRAITNLIIALSPLIQLAIVVLVIWFVAKVIRGK